MPKYKAPLRDIRFVLEDLLGCDDHYQALVGVNHLDADLRNAILNEAAKFSENILAPINLSGDEQGCSFDDGAVSTPVGFKEAYDEYAQGGWAGINASEKTGGQQLPASIGVVITEMMGSANWAWCMYPGLTSGAVKCISLHGSEEQQQIYVSKMVEGKWTGTMCITEPHCGSDIGLARTKAEANADGSFNITGTKIFITGGEQDLVENIVHLTLARIEGAPEGSKGLSLSVVPKF